MTFLNENSQPYFTIVIPTYNRSKLIRRALDSCLRQDFPDFEVIVVDSASTDGTPDVVRSYADSRIFIICEKTRRGVCPARNAGVDVARGKWLVFLDSDDELATGALSLMHRFTLEVGDEIGQLRFACEWDKGQRTPNPPLRDEIWNYEGYIRFLEECARGNTETMSCIRRSTFQVVRFPEDRSYEGLYHLDFALAFKTKCVPEVARLYHTDADDQNSFVPNAGHWLRVAPDVARNMEMILLRHGGALTRWAPTAYIHLLRTTAKFDYLAGDRHRGWRFIYRYLRLRPFCIVGWAILLFGILGPAPLAWLDEAKMRYRRQIRVIKDGNVMQ